MKAMNKLTTKDLIKIAILGAVATVIYYLDFPVPFMPGFIKLDLSNVVALFTGFALGPIPGILVCLIKDVIHLLIRGLGTTMGVGDVFDLVTSCTFVLTASLIYKKGRSKKSALIGSIAGIITYTAISLPLNYYVTYPIYAAAFGGMDAIMGAYQAIFPKTSGLFMALCIFNVPFTIVKGILCTGVVMLIYKPLVTALRKNGLISDKINV